MNELQRVERVTAFEAERAMINVLSEELDRVPHWIPSRALKASLIRVQSILESLYERLEAKPVIAVVGPTGSGKSTLVNALVGIDDVAKVGNDRPTTREITVVAQTTIDAKQLLDRLEHDRLNVVLNPSPLLRNAVIMDTPDTDSMECAQYRDLLESVLGLSDVLICVFDACNPKRQDNIRALAEWVGLFSGQHVFLVLNRSDRIQHQELKTVAADFMSHISAAKAWGIEFDNVLCISARDRLHVPGWMEGEKPLHKSNDFDQLVVALQNLGGGTVFVDQRIARAHELRLAIQSSIRKSVKQHGKDLKDLGEKISKLENEIAQCWVEMLSSNGRTESNTISPLLWGALTQRWWGPIGLSAALCRRMVSFFTPLSLLRSFNPVKIIMALTRSVRSIVGPAKLEQDLDAAMTADTAHDECLDAGIKFLREWPAIADHLVQVGFSPSVREITDCNTFSLGSISCQCWSAAVRKSVNRAADRLSGPLLQFALNTPVLVGLLLAGYFLVRDFLLQSFLPLNFHLHVISLILLLWVLPSCLLQYLVHRSIKRIPTDAFNEAKRGMSSAVENGMAHGQDSVISEVERVAKLADCKSESCLVD